MTINLEEANIRSGPGTDYEIAARAEKGDTFYGTGGEETSSKGGIWYEIYLDDELAATGWVSAKIVDIQ